MSNAKKFLDLATRDKSIAAKLNEAEKAKFNLVLAAAQASGYSFSAQEWNEAIDSFMTEKTVSGENRCYTMFTDCYAVLT